MSVGQGRPAFTLRHNFVDEPTALNAAKGKLEALQRGVQTLSLTVVGNVALQAEGKIQLVNIRKPISTEWIIKRVSHTLNDSGLVTTVEAETITR